MKTQETNFESLKSQSFEESLRELEEAIENCTNPEFPENLFE